MIQVSVGGIPVAIAAGENYFFTEDSLTAGQNPVYEPAFEMTNVTIIADADIQLKINSTSNTAINIKAGEVFIIDHFKVNKIYVYNSAACTIRIFGTD